MSTDNLFALTPQNVAMLLLAVVAGAILSVIYFGGLWFTIQKIDQAQNKALLFMGSFLVRVCVVLAGFYFVSGGRLDRLAVCFISFIITRQLVLKRVQVPEKKENKLHGL